MEALHAAVFVKMQCDLTIGAGSQTVTGLFELALDRLAGEFAAVNQIAKLDAIELLNQTLIDARADRAIERERPNLGV